MAQGAKVIRISAKKQITIPQSFYEAAGFGSAALCELRDGAVVIRPLRDAGEDDERLLRQLVGEGLSGEALIEAFSARRARFEHAVADCPGHGAE